MSERWQRIFAIVVWVIFLAFIALFIYDRVDAAVNPPITRAEWANMLNESFGKSKKFKAKDEYRGLDGNYAAETVMHEIGQRRIKGRNYVGNMSEDDYIQAATDNNIINKHSLDDGLSKKDAQKVISNAMKYAYSADSYPEYCDIKYTDKVYDTKQFTIKEADLSKNSVIISVKGSETPKKGQIILVQNENGIAEAKEIKSISGNGNQYSLKLSDVDNITDVMDEISFSGSADFTAGETTNSERNVSEGDKSGEKYEMGQGISPSTTVAAIYPQASIKKIGDFFTKEGQISGDKKSKKTDITIYVEGNNDGSFESSYESKTGAISEVRKISYSADGKLTYEDNASLNDFEIASEKYERENDKSGKAEDDENNEKVSAEAGAGAAIKVEIKNLQVVAEGLYRTLDPDDERNYIKANVLSDQISIQAKDKGNYNSDIPIAHFNLPIKATAGVVSLAFDLKFKMNLDGELSVVYELDGISAGAEVSSANGVEFPHNVDKITSKYTASITLKEGAVFSVSVNLVDKVLLANPGIEVTFDASAKTIDNKKGYEDYPECVDIQASAPNITIEAFADDKSKFYDLFDKLNINPDKAKIDIDADSLPFHYEDKEHIEWDLDGNRTVIEGDETKCTHVPKSSLPDLSKQIKISAAERVRDKEAEAKARMEAAIENWLENLINKWIQENCGEC